MRIPPRRTNWRLLVRRPGLLLRRYWPALLVLLAGAAADGVTTFDVLRRYGAEAEVHPVQQWVVRAMGPAAGVPAAKTIQLAFVIAVATWWRPWCGWILTACGVLYGLAAISNHWMLM